MARIIKSATFSDFDQVVTDLEVSAYALTCLDNVSDMERPEVWSQLLSDRISLISSSVFDLVRIRDLVCSYPRVDDDTLAPLPEPGPGSDPGSDPGSEF